MREAAEKLRAGGDIGDRAGAREAAARLLEHMAGQELDIHTFDRAASFADRVLARDPYRAMDDGWRMPESYDNGTSRRGGAG